MRSVPIMLHPDYILDEFNYFNPSNLLQAVLTGAVHVPISEMTEGVDASGRSAVSGPGSLRVQGERLVVEEPPTFLWAYKTPYTYGVKRKDGVEIVENGKRVRFVPEGSISNSTVPHRYRSIERIKRWYRRADEGDRIALDYQLSNFSDGRLPVPPGMIEKLFGDTVLEYMENYPSGSPVMVYIDNSRRSLVSSAVSYLGSYPQYDDNRRAFNARAFASAWNGTIIPPGSEASGKETVRFTASRDPEAPGGYASHGSCPPARALRAIVTSAGMPLPRGMTWEFHAVLFGFNPATGIRVRNTGKYPVLIEMWTTGSGANTRIYARLYRLEPA
ncbi:MAG: hypothetical protein GXW97_04980 [Methanothermobacter sp.]|nr:hypothetical protein [Methanothermobacter sp.]